MFSMRERLCAVVTTTVTAMLVIAVLTAASTIIRTSALRPQPIMYRMDVMVTPAYEIQLPTVLTADVDAMTERDGKVPTVVDASNVLWAGPYSPNGVLESNVRPMSTDERLRSHYTRSPLPSPFYPGIRTVDRVLMRVSGLIKFKPLWDWNTKAIYVAVVARYSTKTSEHPAMPLNELTIADAVIRPLSLPRSLRHLRGKELPTMTPKETSEFVEFCESVRNRAHDHESILIDHVNKMVFLNYTTKYPLDDFYDNTLAGEGITLLVRYQVMSLSGWAPLREDVLYGVKHIMLS